MSKIQESLSLYTRGTLFIWSGFASPGLLKEALVINSALSVVYFDFPYPKDYALFIKTAKKPFIFLGFSMGGFEALSLAQTLSHEESLSALYLICVCDRYTPEALDGLEKRLRTDFQEGLKKFYRSCFLEMGNYKVFFKKFSSTFLAQSPAVLNASLSYLRQCQLKGLDKIHAPVYIMNAESDQIASSFSFNSLAKNCHLELMPGGHMDWIFS